MHKYQCYRKECARIRSELGFFMNRRWLPSYEGKMFCSDACLLTFAEEELRRKWKHLQVKKNWKIPRPKLGTILLQKSYITRDQLEEAIRLQKDAREGRIGEWLLRLGFVEEHQITAALARQFGLPLINLKNAANHSEAARVLPGKVASSLGMIPVGFDDNQSSIRVAVSGPVDYNSQECVRRMVHKGIIAYIGDESAIEGLLESHYRPEDLDLSKLPTFSSLEDLTRIGRDMVAAAINQRAQDIQAELFPHLFWIRLGYESESHHHFFRFSVAPVHSKHPILEADVALRYAVGSCDTGFT